MRLFESRILSDYRHRLRDLGWKEYLRILFCWNLAGLIVVVVFFPLCLLLLSLNFISPFDPRVLSVLGAFLLARAVFHRRIGLLADEDDASLVAAVLIVLLALGMWAAIGFQPVGEEKWSELLGPAGVLISYVLSLLILLIETCLALAVPAWFIRGI